MIETGTPDELKESILGNLCWCPEPADFITVKKAFVAQELHVVTCAINTMSVGSGNALSHMHTIKVIFTTHRQADGALAKTLRACRSVRLTLCQFGEDATTRKLSTKIYTAELRGYD